jgi:hypothetical protein
MSEHDKTGGPAFPVTFQHNDASSGCTAEIMGMNLRDYFAAKAMQGLIAKNGQYDESRFLINERMTFDEVAIYAFGQADAMLEARKS